MTRSFPVGGWQTSVVPLGTPGRDDVPPVSLRAFRIERTGTSASSELHFSFPAAAGQSYTLQSNTSLTANTWTVVSQIPPEATSGPVELVLPEDPSTTRIFRIVTPRMD